MAMMWLKHLLFSKLNVSTNQQCSSEETLQRTKHEVKREKMMRNYMCSCTVRARLDGGLSWFIVLASFMQQFMIMGTHNIFGLFYIDLLEEFKKTKAATAWVASLSFGITFLLGPVSTMLSAKYGIRAVSFIGALLFTVGLLLTSFVTDLSQMYLTYSLVVGTGSCFSYYSSILILDQYFYKRLVTSNGIALSGAGVGTITLGPVVGSLLKTYNWRTTLRIVTVISTVQFLCCFVQWFVKPPKRLMEYDFEEKEEKKKNKLLDLSLFKNKAYVVWIVVISLVLFGFYIPYVHLVRHCQDLNISMENGAILVGYLAIAQTIGKLVFGRVADYPRVNRLYLYQMCLVVCSITTTLLPIMTSLPSIIVYCWVFGFHDGCFVLLIAVLTGDIVGKKKMSSAFGMMYSFSCVPMMLGPPVAGWMYNIAGSYVPAFFMAGGFTILGVCLLFLIPILLPVDTAEQWQKRQEVKLPSESEKTVKTWSLSSSECSSPSYSKYSDPPAYDENEYIKTIDPAPSYKDTQPPTYQETQVLTNLSTVPQILIVKEEAKHSSISLILEKYFSMQHLVTQEDSLLCKVYSTDNLYNVFITDPGHLRETDV